MGNAGRTGHQKRISGTQYNRKKMTSLNQKCGGRDDTHCLARQYRRHMTTTACTIQRFDYSYYRSGVGLSVACQNKKSRSHYNNKHLACLNQ
jgi:hypothetical protein